MADLETKCSHCGARPRGAGEFCEFCGARIAGPVLAPSPVAEALSQRFRRLEGHASFEELLKRRPSAAGPIASSLVAVVFSGSFLVVAAFMLFSFSFVGPLVILPIVIAIVGVFVLVRTLSQSSRLASAELVATPAFVSGERTHVSGGGDGPSRTRYYVTIETRDGQRRELESAGPLAGRVSQGDMGVAYVKADHLIGFERVPV